VAQSRLCLNADAGWTCSRCPARLCARCHTQAVQPFCNNAHYWQVFFDTNRAINDVGAAAHYAVPERRLATRSLG